jgi:hypothetical protein
VEKTYGIFTEPLMIAGLPGVANDYVDRILFRYCSPDTFPGLTRLGIYQRCDENGRCLLPLFVQMFRYARPNRSFLLQPTRII